MKPKPIILLLLLLISHTLTSTAQTKKSATLFIYHTDEFWLNLHHFLYVLARTENKEPDATRDAVSGASGDQERALANLKESDRAIWRKAVTAYAQGPAKKDLIFDEPTAAVTKSLALARDSKSLKDSGIDPAYVTILESAAPIYRKVWWDKHRQSNRQWQKTTQALVDKHGPAVLAFILKAYQLEWPKAGFPVHLSAYSNWAGAYSTTGNLLVLSSLDTAGQGAYGLETLFHEAMHQWDDQVIELFRAEGVKQKKRFPRGLSHALIFFTAGEAVKSVLPGHVPFAEKAGIWQRGFSALKGPIEEIWKPYLDGRGTREDAIAELIRRLGTPAN